MKHNDARIETLLGALASPKLATIDLSLARMSALLGALGNPQDALPPVIHVAGTNGKGSLLAYLTAIFQVAGYRVHRYTSPHLVRFNERIMVAGSDIGDDYLLTLLERVYAETVHHPVTFFEATTAAAFLAFAETPADIVLLETGLGGRLDATNLVRSPVLTALTPVSMDHMEYLGDSLAAIAGEKAGIMKASVPCVIGPQVAVAHDMIERTANNINSPLYRFGSEFKVKKSTEGFYYSSARRNAEFSLPNLVGEHQIANAATAIACVDCLDGFAISQDYIAYGITHAVWPARLQRLQTGSLAGLLPPQSELWLDGGHNPDAGKILAAWAAKQQKPIHLICGMLNNKDTKLFLKPLAPFLKSLTAIAIEGEPLSQKPEVILAIAESMGIKNATSSDIKNSIKHIIKYEINDFIILISGSLYLAGNILWQNSQGNEKG